MSVYSLDSSCQIKKEPKKERNPTICSNLRLMNKEPRNTPERPEEVVAYWLSTLPRWQYGREANFYDALIFLRRRLNAMDVAQVNVSRWLMKQDEAFLGPLKHMISKLGEIAKQPQTRSMYEDVEEVLRSRLLRSRSDGRSLTGDALKKFELKVNELQQDLLTKESMKSDQERKELQLLSIQIKFLLYTLKENDFLYETFESARSVLNAFKQQKSVVNEILNWFQIPASEPELVVKEKENKNRLKQKTIPHIQRKVENQEELFSLYVKNKLQVMIALRQMYYLYLSGTDNASKHSDIFESMLDSNGQISKIGTKGHEWEAFVTSAFNLEAPLFVTSRKIDKSLRNFEVKLVAKLDTLQDSIAQSQSRVEAVLANAINNANYDIELKPNNDVHYEISMEPKSGIFQSISYHMSSVFRPQIEELWIDLSVEIYKKYNTKDFKVSIESLHTSQVTITLDFSKDLGFLRTEIHNYVRDQLQKMRVGLNLKIN